VLVEPTLKRKVPVIAKHAPELVAELELIFEKGPLAVCKHPSGSAACTGGIGCARRLKTPSCSRTGVGVSGTAKTSPPRPEQFGWLAKLVVAAAVTATKAPTRAAVLRTEDAIRRTSSIPTVPPLPLPNRRVADGAEPSPKRRRQEVDGGGAGAGRAAQLHVVVQHSTASEAGGDEVAEAAFRRTTEVATTAMALDGGHEVQCAAPATRTCGLRGRRDLQLKAQHAPRRFGSAACWEQSRQ
jgi:hypothetical protein